jgi:predicted ATPase
VRAYADERLAAAGEVDKLRDRHAAYFRTLAEKARPDLLMLRFEGWLDRLEREQDNFRAALDWLASRERVEEALQLATILAPFWYARGYAAEGLERLEPLLGFSDIAVGSGGSRHSLARETFSPRMGRTREPLG